MQSNAAKKRLFDYTIEVIDYYCFVSPLMPTKLIYYWLTQLNPLNGPFIDLNRTQKKSFSENCGKTKGNMSDKIGVKMFVAEKKFVIKEKLKIKEEIETEDLENPE